MQRILTVVLVALACAAAPLGAQEVEFGEAVRVRVVEVDVQVTDKKGRPVTGLTADDFVLFDDGQPVAIQYFSELEPWNEAVAKGTADQEVVSAGIAAYSPASRTTVGLPHLVLYLDDLSLAPADRSRVLDDLARFVESMGGGALTSLLVFDGSLTVLVRPTTNATLLLEGLEAARQRMAMGFRRASEHERVLGQIRSTMAQCGDLEAIPPDCYCGLLGDLVPDLLGIWTTYAEEQAALSRQLSAGLLEAIKMLGGLEGRKSMLYVSSGLKREPGIALNMYVADLCPARSSEILPRTLGYNLAGVLQQVTAQSNANGVTLHTLDAGGVRPMDGSTVRAEGLFSRFSPQISQLRIDNLQGGLFTIAADTGGHAILNQNQPFEALADVRQDMEFGYVLGFSPNRPLDRRAHRLMAALKEPGKGVEVRYRRSYVDRNTEDILVDRLLATLQLGSSDNPLGIEAVIGEPVALDKNVVQAPVQITVPVEAISGGRETTAADLRMRVLAVAMDSAGRRTVVRQKNLEILDRSNGAYRFEIRMKLAPEHYRVAISLELEGAGQASHVVAERDLTVTGN